MPASSKKKRKNASKKSLAASAARVLKKPFTKTAKKIASFRSRRPHRSFRLTKRRDYKRSLKLPGYIAFTNDVYRMLWRNRRVFIGLVIIYAILTALLVGMASQDTYKLLTETIQDTGDQVFSGNFAELGKASLLFVASISGGLSNIVTAEQQMYATIIGLLTWLTTVWLLRNILAGHKVKLRDGIYSAGAPIISTFVVVLVMVVQLLPLAIALLGISAASESGVLEGGVESMLVWLAAALLMILSLFWITSTFIALVVVTLPGMYPFKALSAAGDLVTGRRIRILLRLAWMILMTLLIWTVITIPVIMLDSWLKSVVPQLVDAPTIPILILLLSSFTVVWISSYVYLLYRKVVDDDALPA